MARIELVNLRKSYGPVAAVRDLSCTIEDGEFVVFVGPSGCGKTTTLRLIAGFEEPDRGEIRIDGRVVNDLEPRDRGLGMVFQCARAVSAQDGGAEHRVRAAHEEGAARGAGAAGARSRRDGAADRTCSTSCRAPARAARRSGWRWRARW